MSEAINMHKRIAMGEKLTGQNLKHGGMPSKAPKAPMPPMPKKAAMKRKGAARGG